MGRSCKENYYIAWLPQYPFNSEVIFIKLLESQEDSRLSYFLLQFRGKLIFINAIQRYCLGFSKGDLLHAQRPYVHSPAGRAGRVPSPELSSVFNLWACPEPRLFRSSECGQLGVTDSGVSFYHSDGSDSQDSEVLGTGRL